MIRRSDITTADNLGTLNPGVYVKVLDDTGALGTLYDDSNNLLSNPFTSDAVTARFTYNIADADAGTFTEEFYESLSDAPRKVQAIDLSIGGAASVRYVATRTALAVLSNALPAYLTEAGRAGEFVWSSANLSAEVTADAPVVVAGVTVGQGIHVAPASDATGASGAWVREFSGPLDARWFGLSASATGAVNKAALDDAIAYHFFSGISLELPAGTFNHTGAITVPGNYFNIEGAGRGKTVLKPTSATECLILKGRYGRLARISVDGSVAGTYGIVARDCSEGIIEYCTAANFDNDGLLIDPTYGGGAQGNNDNLRIVGGEFNLNGGRGVRMTEALDNNNVGFDGVNASTNTSHGFLLKGQGGVLDPVCIAAGNGGYGIQIGEDADLVTSTQWQIDFDYVETNTSGGIRGSAKSSNNQINLKSISGTQGYSGHAASSNAVTQVVGGGAYRFGSQDGIGFMQASGSAADMYFGAVHASGGNTNLHISAAGTGAIDFLVNGTAIAQAASAGLSVVAGKTISVLSGGGFAGITLNGTAAAGGFVEFPNAAGVRQGYVGYLNGTRLELKTEGSATGWLVTGDLAINGVQLFNSAGALQVAAVPNSLITYAKIQNVSAAARLLGRGGAAGAGAAQEIDLGGGLTLTATTLSLGAITPASVAIGGGTALTKTVVYAPSLTPASVSAATVAEQTFTVSGLTTADKVIVNPPAIANATGIAGVRVSAADTLAIRFVNPTAGALTPTSGTYTVIAFRS